MRSLRHIALLLTAGFILQSTCLAQAERSQRSRPSTDQIFDKIDTDGDGKLSKEEFNASHAKLQAALKGHMEHANKDHGRADHMRHHRHHGKGKSKRPGRHVAHPKPGHRGYSHAGKGRGSNRFELRRFGHRPFQMQQHSMHFQYRPMFPQRRGPSISQHRGQRGMHGFQFGQKGKAPHRPEAMQGPQGREQAERGPMPKPGTRGFEHPMRPSSEEIKRRVEEFRSHMQGHKPPQAGDRARPEPPRDQAPERGRPTHDDHPPERGRRPQHPGLSGHKPHAHDQGHNSHDHGKEGLKEEGHKPAEKKEADSKADKPAKESKPAKKPRRQDADVEEAPEKSESDKPLKAENAPVDSSPEEAPVTIYQLLPPPVQLATQLTSID